MDSIKRILVIDFCNYEDYPIGGYLSFAKNIMVAFNGDLALIGITTVEDDQIGKWFKKKIKGVTYDYFAVAKFDKAVNKHLIPDRIVIFSLLKYYKKKILEIDIKNVFIQRPEILISVKSFRYQNVCFRFAGLENPLAISKYWYSRYFIAYFDKMFFSSLKIAKSILATGDEDAIEKMLKRSNGSFSRASVIKFPTRINTEIFRRIDKKEARASLNIPDGLTVVSTTGRLGWLKGWKFMIDCFVEFQKTTPHSVFYFIGEGEDYIKIKDYISSLGLKSKIKLVGKKPANDIAVYLNSSDLFIMGSYKEGWSTALLEALGCGVPICTTDFSSAKEIVLDGVTGFVCESREISLFKKQMEKSLLLDRANLSIQAEIKKYAVSELKSDLTKVWKLI